MFRKIFRLPYDIFLEFVCDLKFNYLQTKWNSKDCTCVYSSSLKLLLLAALCYFGRGFALENIKEAAAISRGVNRIFVHIFFLYGSTILYHRHVIVPATIVDPSIFEELCVSTGLNGCIGSTDATHIGMIS